MNIFYGSAATLPESELVNLYGYRYAVFVERLGWDLPGARNGLEIDQFDRPDTIYVGARNAEGRLCGCARLLPTIRPYLLGDVFPALMGGAPVPQSRMVWEVSRFAAVEVGGSSQGAGVDKRQFDLRVSREILAACVKCAMGFGVERLITVSPMGIERLLMRMGVSAHRAGPPMQIDQYFLFACWIDIDDQTIESLNIKNFNRNNGARVVNL